MAVARICHLARSKALRVANQKAANLRGLAAFDYLAVQLAYIHAALVRVRGVFRFNRISTVLPTALAALTNVSN